MVAVPDLRFYVDESALGLGKVLATARTDTIHVGHPLIPETGLRVIRIGGKRDETTWGWLTWLVRRWDDVEEITRSRGPGPRWYVLTERALTEQALPPPRDPA